MRRVGLALVLAAAVGVALPVLAGARHSAGPTYYGQVGAILNEHCAGCHTDGGVAPFPLDSVKDAQRYARAVAAVAKAGTMPPWPPGPDSPHFLGQGARVLSAREKDALAAWAAAGAPAGPKRALPAPRKPAVPHGSRVLDLAPAKAYVPHARGGALDDYHCFLLDPKLARNTYVTAATIRPGASALVHHVILFEAAGTQAAAAARMNAASGGKGWSCFGGPNLPVDASAATVSSLRFGSPQWIAAWVPGHVTDALPKGKGVLVHKGAKIVMQVHYNLVHGVQPDRSRAVLTTAPASAKLQPLETMLLAAPVELPCPSGVTGPQCRRSAALAALTREYGSAFMPTALLFLCGKTVADAGPTTTCDRNVTRKLTVYGVAGHMHLRGRDISIVLDPGTPKQRTLLHIPAWDFRWQDAYYLRDPVALGPGDVLRLSCRFDNSAEAQPAAAPTPRYVVWGEGTTDEMCLGALSVAVG
jgi:mono/diheme cytochrome c family protein